MLLRARDTNMLVCRLIRGHLREGKERKIKMERSRQTRDIPRQTKVIVLAVMWRSAAS